jgi:hypothetical protein
VLDELINGNPLPGFSKSKEKNGGAEYNLYSDYIRDISKTRWNKENNDLWINQLETYKRK